MANFVAYLLYVRYAEGAYFFAVFLKKILDKRKKMVYNTTGLAEAN